MRNAGWGCDSPQIFRSRSLAKYIMTLYNQINQAPKYTIQRVKLVNAVAVILQPGGLLAFTTEDCAAATPSSSNGTAAAGGAGRRLRFPCTRLSFILYKVRFSCRQRR
jgi:hypothetical protein